MAVPKPTAVPWTSQSHALVFLVVVTTVVRVPVTGSVTVLAVDSDSSANTMLLVVSPTAQLVQSDSQLLTSVSP